MSAIPRETDDDVRADLLRGVRTALLIVAVLAGGITLGMLAVYGGGATLAAILVVGLVALLAPVAWWGRES